MIIIKPSISLTISGNGANLSSDPLLLSTARPQILAFTGNQIGVEFDSMTFCASASGPNPVYQFQSSTDGVTFNDLDNDGSSCYTFDNLQTSQTGDLIRVKVSNANGDSYSAPSSITVTEFGLLLSVNTVLVADTLAATTVVGIELGIDVPTSVYIPGEVFDVGTQAPRARGAILLPDNVTLWVLDDPDTIESTIHQYTLSNAGDISTAGYDNISVGVGIAGTRSIRLNPTGTRLYILSDDGGEGSAQVITLSLTAYDLATAVRNNEDLNVNSQSSSFKDLDFSTDGFTLFYLGGDEIFQYTMSTAFQVNTGTYDSKSIDVSSQSLDHNSIRVLEDGETILSMGADNGRVYQYVMTIANDLATASYDSKNFSTQAQTSFRARVVMFFIANDETPVRFYTLDPSNPPGSGDLYQYTLGYA